MSILQKSTTKFADSLLRFVKVFSPAAVQELSTATASSTLAEGSGGTAGPATGTSRLPGRFFKEVGVAESSDGGFTVTLDGRPVRTPAKKELGVPTKALALALAAEWEWQDAMQLRPWTMPLMKLVATSIDQMPVQRPQVIQSLLKYAHTDSLLCREPGPSSLADRQAKVWDPLLCWVQQELGISLPVSTDISGPQLLSGTVKGLQEVLQKENNWRLAAIDSLSASGRSLVVALAVAGGKLSIEDAVEAVRLEEHAQAEEWGFVEGGHDIDVADMRVRMAAPSIFLRLLERRV